MPPARLGSGCCPAFASAVVNGEEVRWFVATLPLD